MLLQDYLALLCFLQEKHMNERSRLRSKISEGYAQIPVQYAQEPMQHDFFSLCLFVDGNYVGEAYCPAFMGQRISEWEAKVMRRADAAKARMGMPPGFQ